MMVMSDKKSTNYTILKKLISLSKHLKLPSQIDYIIIYSFLYKYCSDIIKDYLLFNLKNKELTIDEAYKNDYVVEEFICDSLKLNGFFIKNSKAFIDDVVREIYSKSDFLSYFLNVFPKYTIFDSQYCAINYFDYLFKIIDDEIDTSEFDSEITENINEIINLISKLDVFDSDFEFSEVFNILSASRLMHIESNPDYIIQILTEIILSDKKTISSVYDPFINDASMLMGLYAKSEYKLEYFYGKDENKVNFLFSFVILFISHVSIKDIYLKNEDALESIDINGALFDVILSRIPISIKNYYSSKIKQNSEIIKRNKCSEIENILLNNLNIDSDLFKQDSELNQALENLVDKINYNYDLNNDFVGEYESLKESEFLFLINLIDSLKEDGMMVISISENFLFKESLETLRKYLTINKNYLDSIIRIPNEIDCSRPEVVLVFKKNKFDNDILFIDMSSDYETERNSGLFGKNLLINNNTIDKMKNVVLNKLSLPKFSNLISIEEIKDNNFNLSVSRYVDTFEGEFISLTELKTKKIEIESNINDLNIKIEKMMDELNIHF